jgi:hypothetical protein
MNLAKEVLSATPAKVTNSIYRRGVLGSYGTDAVVFQTQNPGLGLGGRKYAAFQRAERHCIRRKYTPRPTESQAVPVCHYPPCRKSTLAQHCLWL